MNAIFEAIALVMRLALEGNPTQWLVAATLLSLVVLVLALALGLALALLLVHAYITA